MSTDEGRPWEGGGDLPWDAPEGVWEPADGERGAEISTWANGRRIWPVRSTGSTRKSRAMSRTAEARTD